MGGYTVIYKYICVWDYDYYITCIFTHYLFNNILIFNRTDEFSGDGGLIDPQHNTIMLDRIPCFPSEYLVY